ncbi:flagellar biosynthetic protein FliO [Agrobacterium vitis]|nr:flagellar biosynthetic protein FliO [Agrobacterium vitis]NSZ53088.1 flagellar biosynthesis protein FliO [Agrobacterium vitis]NTA31847.1 flagellar biosynthesis protein FliO [Agrobacterium vitis]
MMDDILNAYGSRFLIAAGGVFLALAVLVVILWILKNRAPSPFVRGGRNRQPRLQVLDAAAVDARRRLVLIRRDNIEHLILIGGPTDIVVESGIGEPKAYLAGELAANEALVRNQELLKAQELAALASRQVKETEPTTQAALQTPPSRLDIQPTRQEPRPQPVSAPPQKPVARPVAAAPAQDTVSAAAQAMPAPPAPQPLGQKPMQAPAALKPKPEDTIQHPQSVERPPQPAAPQIPPQQAQPIKAPVTQTQAVVQAENRQAAPEPLTAAIAPEIPMASNVRAEPRATETITAQPVTAVSSPPPSAAPVVNPPLSAGRNEAPAETAPDVEPPMMASKPAEVSMPVSEPRVAPATTSPQEASLLLDAARERVLKARVEPFSADRYKSPTPPDEIDLSPEPAAEKTPQEDSGPDLDTLKSEFEKILDGEILTQPAARPKPTVEPPVARAIAPIRTPPGANPQATVTSDPAPKEGNLQDEIARIFGEMGAPRKN